MVIKNIILKSKIEMNSGRILQECLLCHYPKPHFTPATVSLPKLYTSREVDIFINQRERNNWIAENANFTEFVKC